MGMRLWEEAGPPADNEPLTLGNLEKFGLKNKLLGIELDDEKHNDLFAIAQAEGSLPPGNLGKVWFNETNREIKEFINRWGSFFEGKKDKPLEIDLLIDGVRLSGQLNNLINNRQVLYRCGKTRPKDRLGAWVRHLVACADDRIEDLQTSFFSLDKANKFVLFDSIPSEEALEYSSPCFRFTNQAKQPTSFFCIKFTVSKGNLRRSGIFGIPERALAKARNEWMPADFNHAGPKESELPENRICFPSPLHLPEFAALASLVFSPLLRFEGG